MLLLATAIPRPAVPLVEARILPDLTPEAGFTPGRGLPGTGLSRAPDGSWWSGIGIASPSPSAGLVHLPADFSRNLGMVTVTDLGFPAGSVQGVAADGGDLWFVLKASPNSWLIRLDAAGKVAQRKDLGEDPGNGIAIDRKRGQIILLHDSGHITWLDRRTLQPAGRAMTVALRSPDHLFHDAAHDRLYITSGRNRRDGIVSVYDLARPRTPITSRAMQGADAIEGIAVAPDGRIRLINDGATHDGRPEFNRVLTYPPL